MAAATGNKPPRPFNVTIFNDSPWCVALGDPGSGKSTSLKKLLLDYTEQAQDQTSTNYSGIPIFIPLRSFARDHYTRGQGYSILDFIYDYGKGTLSASCSHGFYEYFLDAGECLVCFDGLDEVVLPGQRQEVQKLVEAFIHRYPRNRYIITSRIVGYNEAPLSSRLFPHYIVQPLSKEDINLYVHQWYATREKSKSEAESRANELFDTIQKSVRLSELASNPLLLAIIALVHRIEAELPHERVKLYDKCSEALLTTFETVKRLERTDLDKAYYRYRREILESVAFWMQAESATNPGREALVNEAELQYYISRQLTDDSTYQLNKADAWQQAEAFIKLMKERTGILIDRGEKQFGFIHLTFQEYFTASYIQRNYIFDSDQIWEQIESHLVDPAWREVILLLLGKLNEFKRLPSMMVERIIDNQDDEEHILRRRLSLATACIADHIRLETTLQTRIVDEWLGILRRPLCKPQNDIALAALTSIKQNPIIQERMQQIAADANELPHLRVAIASLYRDEEDALDWVFQTLNNVICNQTISREVRKDALGIAIKLKSYTDKAREIVLKLMKMDHDSINVCADIFINRDYQPEFEEWFFPTVAKSSEVKIEQPKRKSVLKKQDIDRIVEADNRFIFILARIGRIEYWPDLVAYTHESNRPSEQLLNLLENQYRIIKEDIPKQYQKKLTKCLVYFAKCQNRYTKSLLTILIWLLELDYPLEDLINLILEIDTRFESDDWDIRDMYSFFMRDLFTSTSFRSQSMAKGKILNSSFIAQLERREKLTIKLAIINGIARTDRSINNVNTAQKITEEINTNEAAFLNGDLMRYLAENSCFEFLVKMLKNSKIGWIKFDAINLLKSTNKIKNQTALENLLEITAQESDDFMLKASAASLMADFGALDQGSQILRELIIETQANEQEKSHAFRRLEEMRAFPNSQKALQ